MHSHGLYANVEHSREASQRATTGRPYFAGKFGQNRIAEQSDRQVTRRRLINRVEFQVFVIAAALDALRRHAITVGAEQFERMAPHHGAVVDVER